MQTILVIDDDPLVRRTIERVLQRGGYKIHLAADGLEGLRMFRSVLPDLVITDIVMPVKEGLDTIRLLKTWNPDAKIIAISGAIRGGNKDFRVEAAALGASAALAKPFEPPELLELVTKHLADTGASAV